MPAAAGDLFVGLTEKGITIDQAMKASMSEYMIEVDPDKFQFGPGAMREINRRFEALWKRLGLKRSLLHMGIVEELIHGPKHLSAMLESLRAGDEEGSDFEKLTLPELRRATTRMIEAELVTLDTKAMWMKDPPGE